jgi:hypothetical protein
LISLIGSSQFNWSTEASYMPVKYRNFGSKRPDKYTVNEENKGFGFKLKQNYIIRNDKNNFGILTGITFTYYQLESDIYYIHNRGTTSPLGRPINYGKMQSSKSILNANIGLELYNTDKFFYLQLYTSPTIIGSSTDNYNIIKGTYYTPPDTSYSITENETFVRSNRTFLVLFPKVALQTGIRLNVSKSIKLNIGLSFEYATIREDNYYLNDFYRAYLGILF